MKFLVTALLLSASALAQSSASPEPYHIKNDVLGESISAYLQNNPDCKGTAQISQTEIGGKWSGHCFAGKELGSAPSTYAGIPVKIKRVEFAEDCFVSLVLFVEHDNYPVLRDNLIAKFGEPTKRSSVDAQNKMGQGLTGAFLTWDNGVSSIRLSEHVGDMDLSAVSFAMDYYSRAKPLSKPSKDM
jgi:hypothetical protein